VQSSVARTLGEGPFKGISEPLRFWDRATYDAAYFRRLLSFVPERRIESLYEISSSNRLNKHPES
jgi:hypothetical protein